LIVSHLQLKSFWIASCLVLSLFTISRNLSAQNSKPVWADTLRAKELLASSNKLNRRELFDASLQKAEEAVAILSGLYGENHVKTVNARMYVARVFRNKHKYAASATMFKQCLEVFIANHDTFNTMNCANNFGISLVSQEMYPEAKKYFNLSIQLARRDSAHLPNFLAQFKINLGNAFNQEKNYHEALVVLEEAKSTFTYFHDDYTLGLVNYHIGEAYYGLHDYTRAKENYLSSFVHLNAVLESGHSYLADLQVKIGLCLQQTGEPETGLIYLLKAKDAYLRYGINDVNYSRVSHNLGQYYLGQKMYSAAIEQLELSLNLKEKLFTKQSTYLLNTLESLGEAYAQSGQFDRSSTQYRRALHIIADSLNGNNKTRYPLYIKLAELQFARGDHPGCQHYCDTAFQISGFDPDHPENAFPREYFRKICQIRARSFYQQFFQLQDTSYLLHAERYFELAVKTLFLEVSEISVTSSRETFYDHDHDLLEQLLDAYMQLFKATGNRKYAIAAFQIAGHNKAFLLAESMSRNGSLRYSGIPESILLKVYGLQDKISDAEKLLNVPDHRSPSQMDTAALGINRDLSMLRKDYEALLHQIEKTYAGYFRLAPLSQDIPIANHGNKSLAPDQGILMYGLTSTSIYSFVLTRDTFCFTSIPMDASFKEQLESFPKSLTEYYRLTKEDDALYDQSLKTYIDLARVLYEKLVLPVAALLPGRIVIIPENILCYMPFEALLTGPPKDVGNFRTYPYWAREKSISYSLSTDFLKSSTPPTARKPSKNWLGLAPFTGTVKNENLGSRSKSNTTYPPLPFSGIEVKTIASLVHGEVWLDSEARKDRFSKETSEFRILHLATHSHADDRLGDYSSVAISADGDPLLAKDLYKYSLNAEMVVLSACEAAGGKMLRGEGIIGLVRAFTYAGSQSIVASLWAANDQSTATLMVDFYKSLLEGHSKDEALKAARMKAMNQMHPFFWAGFRVYGKVTPLWP
jgi:CHAT domain-containing protein